MQWCQHAACFDAARLRCFSAEIRSAVSYLSWCGAPQCTGGKKDRCRPGMDNKFIAVGGDAGSGNAWCVDLIFGLLCRCRILYRCCSTLPQIFQSASMVHTHDVSGMYNCVHVPDDDGLGAAIVPRTNMPGMTMIASPAGPMFTPF